MSSTDYSSKWPILLTKIVCNHITKYHSVWKYATSNNSTYLSTSILLTEVAQQLFDHMQTYLHTHRNKLLFNAAHPSVGIVCYKLQMRNIFNALFQHSGIF